MDFQKLAIDLNRYMISLDLYVFGNNKMKNLAGLSENIRLSGGNLCYYPDCSDNYLNKFFNELMYNISKETTWEAVFRIRVSRGWKKVSYGNYYSSTYNDLLRV